jgi:hypothetical protein
MRSIICQFETELDHRRGAIESNTVRIGALASKCKLSSVGAQIVQEWTQVRSSASKLHLIALTEIENSKNFKQIQKATKH